MKLSEMKLAKSTGAAILVMYTIRRKTRIEYYCRLFIHLFKIDISDVCFPVRQKNDSISLLRPNLNFDCIVTKEGRDVISVTLRFGLTSRSDVVSRKKSGINMKDPKYEL